MSASSPVLADSSGGAVSTYDHGRVPREVRRRQILELADELFIERGYHGASMAELARRAGITKPVIYDLVGSKEELFRACAKEASVALAREIADAVATQAESVERLRAGAVATFRFAAKHRRSAAAMFPESGAGFADLIVSLQREHAVLIAGLLAEDAARRGGDPDPRRLEAAANALVGGFEAMALWWRDNEDISPEQLADWLVDLMRAGLDQLLTAS